MIRSSRVWRNAGGSCARLFCSHFENFSRHSERSLSSSALGGIQLRGCNCFFEVLLGRAATLPTWEHVPVDGTHVFVPTIAPLKCCLSLSAKKVTRGSTNSYVKRRLVTQGGWYAVGIGTVLTARSRLYRNEFLQENMHLTAFFKLYKICILLHRCNLKILAKNRFEKSAIFVKMLFKFISQNILSFGIEGLT